MRRILATLAVVGALLFGAGSAWADAATKDIWAAHKRGDYATALREVRPLAEQGNVWAQEHLGFIYEYGYGVPENDAEAVKWYRKAAEQGDSDAMLFIGLIYADDEGGVPQNYVQAYMWFSLAKTKGNPLGETLLKDLKSKNMNSTMIAKAQRLATEWWEEHND